MEPYMYISNVTETNIKNQKEMMKPHLKTPIML